MLTPARSKDFVVLKVSEDILPSKRKVLGVFGAEDALLASDLTFAAGFASAFDCWSPKEAADGVSDPLEGLLLLLGCWLYPGCACP